jgi:hypothetical protein
MRSAVVLCWFATLTASTIAAPATTRPATTQAAATQPANWCTHVGHTPQHPKPGQPVRITATVTSGFTNVTLQYQLVDPGEYIELKDEAYTKNWTSISMQSTGATSTATLPPNLQTHRRLVRYRITAVTPGGQTVTAPQTNYAYFVYGDLPAWSAAIQPGSDNPKRAAVTQFPPEVFARIQPYQLLGKKTSIENATWKEQSGGKEYKYTGTLVVDGIVHDHIHYRARGGVWRYALGKNMWKFDLPEGEHLQAKDDFGRPFPSTWSKVNLRCIIQLGDYGRRGEQGMYESVGFRLFNLAGVPAPKTTWVQLRIIDEPDETPANQYQGDFWGLYLAIENEDGHFLRAHHLPDGNLFKMAGGSGELNHHGEDQPTDRSDLNAFLKPGGARTSISPPITAIAPSSSASTITTSAKARTTTITATPRPTSGRSFPGTSTSPGATTCTATVKSPSKPASWRTSPWRSRIRTACAKFATFSSMKTRPANSSTSTPPS